MKKLIVSLLAFQLFFLGCQQNKSAEKTEKENYEKAKESLEQRERKNPVLFLSVSSKEKHNLIGQTVVKGTVKNNAKICSYKDVQLEISFYSKTGTLLEKDNDTVYEEIAPGTFAEFKSKYFTPKGTDSVRIKVLGAKAGN